MREEKRLFSILLPLDNMFRVYSDIQDIVKSSIDLKGYSFDNNALNNSLEILEDIKIIKKTKRGFKKKILLDRYEFECVLKEKIFDNYKPIIENAISEGKHYSVESKEFYISKNAIPLKYSGLFMLLYELRELSQKNNHWFLTGAHVKELLDNSSKKISLDELEKNLLIKKQLGNEAEEFAFEYERKKLIAKGIEKEPIRISLIDVSAGFDILSYDNDSKDEIYIEVKSCDNDYVFHFTNNEISKSKLYKNRYWLYLYNRIDKTIIELCNPYEVFFEKNSDEWLKKPDGYLIKKS